MDVFASIFRTPRNFTGREEEAFLPSPGPQEYSGDYFDGVQQVWCDNGK